MLSCEEFTVNGSILTNSVVLGQIKTQSRTLQLQLER